MLNKNIRKSLIIASSLSVAAPVYSQTTIGEASEKDKQVTVITPKKQVPDIKTAQIDDEKFEFGVFIGLLSIEDFDTNTVNGFSVNYHINPRWLANFSYGQSGEANATFEEVLNENFVRDREDGFQFTSISAGYRLFSGRSYLNKNLKFNSHVYLGAGVESIDFAGESDIGAAFSMTYKVVLSDWLTSDLIFRDHIYQRDFLGDSKTTQNLELSWGLNVLF